MAPQSRLTSFPPSIDGRCRLLVLGSAPSVRSLERAQYYGHPQNAFWPIIEELFGIDRNLGYEMRLARLRRHGVAVWDVVRSCRRTLSADATITDVEVNDFEALFARYRRIRAVYFNGSKSEQLFARHVGPGLDVDTIRFERLPSTSPANAGMRREEKIARWRVLLDQPG